MLNKFFSKIVPFMKYVEKCCGYSPQVESRRMCIACWIPKATDTHSEYVILLSHCNNGCTKAPQYYSPRTLPVLFSKFTEIQSPKPRVDGPESLHFQSILSTCNCHILISRAMTIKIANNESVKSVR
jgi:hypothetical protein